MEIYPSRIWSEIIKNKLLAWEVRLQQDEKRDNVSFILRSWPLLRVGQKSCFWKPQTKPSPDVKWGQEGGNEWEVRQIDLPTCTPHTCSFALTIWTYKHVGYEAAHTSNSLLLASLGVMRLLSSDIAPHLPWRCWESFTSLHPELKPRKTQPHQQNSRCHISLTRNISVAGWAPTLSFLFVPVGFPLETQAVIPQHSEAGGKNIDVTPGSCCSIRIPSAACFLTALCSGLTD